MIELVATVPHGSGARLVLRRRRAMSAAQFTGSFSLPALATFGVAGGEGRERVLLGSKGRQVEVGAFLSIEEDRDLVTRKDCWRRPGAGAGTKTTRWGKFG